MKRYNYYRTSSTMYRFYLNDASYRINHGFVLVGLESRLAQFLPLTSTLSSEMRHVILSSCPHLTAFPSGVSPSPFTAPKVVIESGICTSLAFFPAGRGYSTYIIKRSVNRLK